MTDTPEPNPPDSPDSSNPSNSAESRESVSSSDAPDTQITDSTANDHVDETTGASESADEPDPDGDSRQSSLGRSVAVYSARLAFAFLVITARILVAGGKLALEHFGDAGSRNQTRRWVVLQGDRRVIIGGFVTGVFVITLLLGVSDVIGIRESRFVTTMFSTMIAGLFSFIPIVVSVNQLIVSRLFGTPDRLTERIDGVHEFRARVESQTSGDGVSPTDPAPFLARLAGTLGERAESLLDACKSGQNSISDTDSESRSSALEAVCAFASRTSEHAEMLGSRLTGETTSVFAVVVPTMNHDYAGTANEARRLTNRFDEELPDRVTRTLSELRELYVTADATRQYFTTMYLQQELARLSRLITYSGTAALLLSALVIMIYASGYPPVAHEGPLLALVSLALAVAFSPLAVLFAYVVRIATVLKHTSAPGAFTPPEERNGDD